MRDLHSKVLTEFSTQVLEDIIGFGKYKVRGFRIGSKNTPVKRKMMENELLRNRGLSTVLEDYANSLVHKKSINNMWTFKDSVDSETVGKKIKKDNKQSVILELISNKKYEILEEFLREDHVEILPNNDVSKESMNIELLRSIISNLESENNKLMNMKQEMVERNIEMNKELELLNGISNRQKNKILKSSEELLKYESIIRNNEVEFTKLKTDLVDYKEENVAHVKKMNRISKITILVEGGKKTRKWFNHMNANRRFNFIFGINELNKSDNTEVVIEEFWIVTNLLPSVEIKEIEKADIFKKANNINRVRLFTDFEEIKKCMKNLEGLYYE